MAPRALLPTTADPLCCHSSAAPPPIALHELDAGASRGSKFGGGASDPCSAPGEHIGTDHTSQLAAVPEDTVREIWSVRHGDDPERVGTVLSKAEFDDMRLRTQRQWAPTPHLTPPHSHTASLEFCRHVGCHCAFTRRLLLRAAPHSSSRCRADRISRC